MRFIVRCQKLNYIFHNPNTIDATAKYLLDIFVEANTIKVENAINAMNELEEKEDKNNIECPT